jgi:hypothetical protein
MILRLFKRRKAIKSFVFKLPIELGRRFGEKRFYSLEEVGRRLEEGKYDKAFSAYAYALLCSRSSFDAYFSQLNVKCTYDGLRKFVAKKYFKGIIDFDASSIIRFAKGIGNKSYYDSDHGTNFCSGSDISGHH